MARYNKIYAGPFTEALPQTAEADSAVAITPGMALVLTSGAFALAGAATVGQVYIAQDNYLTLANVDDPIAIGDTVIGLIPLPTQLFNVLVATGNNLVKGDALTLAASGLFAKASTADMVVGFADETYNNNTGSSQLVRMRGASGYMTAA